MLEEGIGVGSRPVVRRRRQLRQMNVEYCANHVTHERLLVSTGGVSREMGDNCNSSGRLENDGRLSEAKSSGSRRYKWAWSL